MHDPVRPHVDGLPIGLQIVGPMFGDVLVLRAAPRTKAVRPIARPELGRWHVPTTHGR